MEKSTQELEKILNQVKTFDEYMEKEEENLNPAPLHELLKEHMAQKKISAAELINRSGLDRTYTYQILSGAKRPSREKVEALSFALSLTLEEVQTLLRRAGYPTLYAKNQRDSILIFVLQRHGTLADVNELLFDYGYDILA
ncbi:MAG: helix-turn-helix domain-containing protein [Lachnospiraceae bacterium]